MQILINFIFQFIFLLVKMWLDVLVKEKVLFNSRDQI